MMITFQDRITWAFKRENMRRANAGESRLTKKALWEAAEKTSASVSHWFGGANGADLDTCMRIAPELGVSARWLFDGKGSPDEVDDATAAAAAVDQATTNPEESPEQKLEHIKKGLAHMLTAAGLEDDALILERKNVGAYTPERIKIAVSELMTRIIREAPDLTAPQIGDLVVLTLQTWIEGREEQAPGDRDTHHGNEASQ